MPIVPETRAGKLMFYRVRVPHWAEDPAAIGLTGESVAEMQGLVDEAWEAYTAHLEAMKAARGATMRYHQAVRRMHAGAGNGTGGGVACGSALLQRIKGYAQITGDNAVYARAGIDPPAKPGRPGSAPAPGTPHSFAVSLKQTGEIELTWKCDNPDGTAGTIYQVRRALDGGPATPLAVVGEKRLVDETVPPGTKSCRYWVTALRSTGKGGETEHTVHFGGGPPKGRMQIPPRRLVA